ncbi:hypothetical protein GF407_00560 [candidate division KSB1 bacterium]|nr:hypothetical protein [candidate division KSB1 bacterium]
MVKVDLNTEAPDFTLKNFEENEVSPVTRFSASVKTQFKRNTAFYSQN